MLRTSLLCCLLALGTLVWSQAAPPRIDIFGGYSYTTSFAPAPYNSGGKQNGWSAALDLDSNRWIGFRFDFVQYHATYNTVSPNHSTTYTYLFGPKILLTRSPDSRIIPFGDFLIGGATLTSHPYLIFTPGTSFAYAFGGGLDLRLSKHFALRGEGDFMHTSFTSYDNQMQPSVKNWRPRAVTGLVFRF